MRASPARGDPMQKLILLSGLMAVIIVPALAARDHLPRRGLKRAVIGYFAFTLWFLFALLYIYPRFPKAVAP